MSRGSGMRDLSPTRKLFSGRHGRSGMYASDAATNRGRRKWEKR
jgi:hypothetical protein